MVAAKIKKPQRPANSGRYLLVVVKNLLWAKCKQ